MKRRRFLTASAGLFLPDIARASNNIIGMGPMGPLHRAFVAQPQLVQQKCAEWCWAASTSMVFACHGHPLDQLKIVNALFSPPACIPAPTTSVIGQILSSNWTDDYNQAFFSRVSAVFDPSNGLNTLNNMDIIGQLSNNCPLLYTNTQHCMMVVDATYFDTPSGPSIQSVGVLDPWPYVPSPYHQLSPAELMPINLGGQMQFLAAVAVWP